MSQDTSDTSCTFQQMQRDWNLITSTNICNHWVSKRQVRPLHSHNPARAILELLCLFVYTILGNRSWKVKHHIEGKVTEKSYWRTSRHGRAQSVQSWVHLHFLHLTDAFIQIAFQGTHLHCYQFLRSLGIEPITLVLQALLFELQESCRSCLFYKPKYVHFKSVIWAW